VSKKILPVLAIVLSIILGVRVFVEYGKTKQSAIPKTESTPELSAGDILSSERVSTGNFEGPEVQFAQVSFYDKDLNSTQQPHLFFSPNSINYDPDDQDYGLPNIIGNIGPVSLYEPKEDKELSDFLFKTQGSREPKPYKEYQKRIVPTDNGKPAKILKMQLWLTEFSVDFSIRPERKPSGPRPGGLDEEWTNNRYGNLHFFLRIIPNNAPWYFKTPEMKNEKAEMAVAAVYCNSLTVVREPEQMRISPNIHKGMALPLYPRIERGGQTAASTEAKQKIVASGDQLFNERATALESSATGREDSIWNKEYYIELFFNNIGSWREGFLGTRKYDDQVVYGFLMPIFVIGSWDVIPPKEVIPDYAPHPAYFKEFKLSNLLPSFGLKAFGKILSAAALIFILFMALTIVFPTTLTIVKSIAQGLRRLFGKK
jgi:hypothetical protein